MRTAAAYIRVSTEEQIEFSPESQIKEIRGYAQRNNIMLPDKYVFLDEGISGRSTGKRTAFKQMIALAKTVPKPFDIILVWKYSRFARNREDSVVYKSMLRKQLGIDVFSVSEPVGDDKMSVLFEAMIEAMDEYYSINLAEEVKRGMTEKAHRGGVLTVAPFGYEVKDGGFSVIDREAEIVRDVFQSYARGDGFLTIAKKLNLMGIRTHRGGKIENRTVEYWLNNPVYAGKVRWNPNGRTARNYECEGLIIADGMHTPIIGAELWDAVQERLAENKRKNRKYSREPHDGISHWLVGILRCGICGHVLSNCSGYFYCSQRGRGLCRGNGGISVRTAEKTVSAKIGELLDEAALTAVPEPEPRRHGNTAEDMSEERLIGSRISENEKKLCRVREAYENGIDTIEEYRENKKRLTAEGEQLKKMLERLQTDTAKGTAVKSSGPVPQPRRISELLCASDISCAAKNKAMKGIIKEIIKTGSDGKELYIVFRDFPV